MSGLRQHLSLSLRLHLRNRMALIYGYLFPLIFLVAFWVLYRYEKFPLIRHLGELLTVSVLGGACFGLPTTLVSERERGVWRRYRLAPIATWRLVVSTVVARYLIVVSAGLLQLGLAKVIGMPWPAHPFGLWFAFTMVSFAFIGLGLVIAMLADNVPAVQALGQCIFLPMLIIGGVAVNLASLPPWAQQLSAFFPGRYAVEAMQVCANGVGLSGARFSLLSLALIGGAGCLAGAKMFRWDARQKFSTSGSKAWLAVALGAWLAVGLLAEYRGHIAVAADAELAPAQKPSSTEREVRAPSPTPTSMASSEAVTAPPIPTPSTLALKPTSSVTPVPTPTSVPTAAVQPTTPLPPIPTPPPSAVKTVVAGPASWEAMTKKEIDGLDYSVPPDEGVVSPMAPPNEEPEEDVAKQLAAVSRNLIDWPPDKTKDVVQRVRNSLYVAAVPDVVQLPVERFLPELMLEHLEDNIPKNDLIKILGWIALHPEQGTVVSDTNALGIDAVAGDPAQIRERAYYYAIKFLIRLTDRKP